MLDEYLEPEQVAEVYQAYLFGAEAHDGQHRLSGEPYITHPIAVARILAELRVDHLSIMAAILHDVIEDTKVPKEMVEKRFGKHIAELVDGVSKLTHIHFENKAEAQAENFRKMMLAMTRDIRVILIKLADRLHNMRTLGVMRPDKRRRIARETLDIYAPIANRLGMNNVRLELEDLGFSALYPLRSKILEEGLKKARGNRKEIVGKMEETIKSRLKQEGLVGRVIGREKHLYSIYKKMRDKHLSFSEVMDVYAFRIIVDKVDACYRVLGAIHNLYTPVPGRFKDYIAIPKANGYQSLHTVLMSPYGVAIEVQIRTEDMHKVSEAGIAAHWMYKTNEGISNNAQMRARQWLHELLEMQQNAGNSIEFLEHVKVDLFPDEVYVLTPHGEIKVLPRGATAVDFAYAVHSDVGNQCVAAKIDRRLMPLRTVLLNGQTVEIVTSRGAQPNPAWLDFVTTAKARSNIRAYLKNLHMEEAVLLGMRLLHKSLAAHGLSLDNLDDDQVNAMLTEFGFESMEQMFSEIGFGNQMAMVVARVLLATEQDEVHDDQEKAQGTPLAIKGTEGTVVTYAKCCRPIPGDPILGFVTSGRGIVIHTEDCKNVAEYRNRPEKWIDVKWEKEIEGEFPIDIRMLVQNLRGVLARVAASLSEMEANIENVTIEERDGLHSTLSFTVSVKNRQHLARIMRRLRKLEIVSRIHRLKR
ncbi:bifunctional GTP diphosphokinase/guanosine-3',5'-bis pyrophosphate 3'-pyrophosphohydrolase [Thiohalophilus thiocyanatoxydans]|uniref:guanosine-3',5'-bis(diphosphate) 3'-diphosphatase n=1 Tax=Thiohalophilus thiocyanatoxydans TaxID=381308 RepID=A0A4V3H4Q4_9GAMM|nr:bifunctional GTP diphosphokinase/guanosine-3',5'-bis pyrophosphate 3'-pyrophosphohydrolase [Thiohalophilus thiocyanatoxydans]TDY04065.1 GTP pyrophosphokinase/guanosine-3',5'-bis(diphosphate) 3'-pyrophosphohydrolase [Thiohalophilus thiocyanatoxydans]